MATRRAPAKRKKRKKEKEKIDSGKRLIDLGLIIKLNRTIHSFKKIRRYYTEWEELESFNSRPYIYEDCKLKDIEHKTIWYWKNWSITFKHFPEKYIPFIETAILYKVPTNIIPDEDFQVMTNKFFEVFDDGETVVLHVGIKIRNRIILS